MAAAKGNKYAVGNKGGRPSTYSQEIADHICECIAMGESLRAVLGKENMPSMITVLQWLDKHDEFSSQYSRAREQQTETLGDMMHEKSKSALGLDAAGVQAVKLEIETLKWFMGKVKPKKWGDRIQVDNTHAFEQQSTDDLQTRAIKLAQSLGFPALNALLPANDKQQNSE